MTATRHSFKSTALAAATVTAFASGLFAGAAQAGDGDPADYDWKGYTGTNCQPMSETADIRRSVTGLSTAFANMGSRGLSTVCPLVRDNHEGGPGRLELVRVRVRDRNERYNTTCILRSHSLTGATVDSDSASTSGVGTFVLSLGPVDANNWGSYSLLCSLPGRGERAREFLPSYIINYRAMESTL